MSTPHERSVPEPGPITAFFMRRRLSRAQRRVLLDELAELYEHRVVTEGPRAADRWMRRELRRWTWRLLRGDAAVGPSPTDPIPATNWSASGLLRDLRHNARGLRRAPLFSAALVLTVGIGIGGTTLVFAVVHSVLVAPLPYDDPEELVLLRTVRGPDMWSTSMADLDALYEPPPAFESVSGYSYQTRSVALGDRVELIRTKAVTANYFPMLGIQPVHGRAFAPEESEPGAERVVMVTQTFARQALGGEEAALEARLSIDGAPHAVVGVLPDRMGPLERVGIYPALTVETPSRKGPFYYPMIGRLGSDVDRETVQAQLDAVAERQFPIWRESFTYDDATLGFLDLKEIIVGDVSRTLLVVLTGVGFLLLIASANAASLLVTRGIARHREVSIRAALGASEGRLFQLLVSEAGVLAGGGAVLGLAIAGLGIGVVRARGIGQLPRAEELALTAPVLAFFLAVTVGSWILFGVIASGSVLRRGTHGVATPTARATASPAIRRLRRSLVAAQFAITIPLLVGAGLLARSLDHLQNEDLGFDPGNLVSMQVSLPAEAYTDGAAVRDFWLTMLPEIEALPDVLEAGLADARPPVQWPHSNNFVLGDRPPDPNEPTIQAPWITADPGYFDVLGVALLDGRIYAPLSDTMRTAVVDEAWARRFYPDQSPVGRRFRSGGCTIEGCPWTEVVGVVSTIKTTGVDDDHRYGTIYSDFRRDPYSSTNLHLRTRGEPLAAVPAVRRLIAERDPSIPIADVMTVDDVTAESLMGRRYTSMLVALVAGVALLLSVVGIYGAMSYFVRQHTRDLGIRIALGGGPDHALRLVVGQGMRVALVGTVLGAAAAFGLTRYMSSLLYEVTATDPMVFGVVSLGTLFVALGASAVPGRVAATTDPARTLREE